MTDLSPAAQAVWLAWEHSPMICKSVEDLRRQQLAAALRAVATDWEAEIKGQFNTEFIRGIVNCIMALQEIAAELEGNNG